MIPISRRKALADIGLLAGLSLVSGCAVNPVTGKRELMLMSEAEEISLGKEAHGQILAEYGSYGDETMQSWFTEHGKEMAVVTQRRNLPWTFTVLDSPVINAFAVPGGYIYVTRGILGYFNNEAQFAGVLAHELGHVNARHTASTYSKSKLANVGLAVGSIISEKFAQFADLASLGTSLLFLKFSRDDERQADQLGVQYSSAVGYDAVQMSDFFQTLERLHPGGGSLPAWQSTHPDPGDRIVATKRMALAYQSKHPEVKFVSRRDDYLDRINGLVFGDNPLHGYLDGDMFYHPEMKFQFPTPKGWKMTNLPTEVRLSPEKQNALLIFTLAQGVDANAAATAFQSGNNVQISSSTAVTVNGRKGVKAIGQMQGQNQTLGIVSYYIPMDGKVFTFHGLSASTDHGGFLAVFESSAMGFDNIKDASKIKVTPKKIEVRIVTTNTTFKDALNKFGVPEDKLNELAIINGVGETDVISAGSRIKIVAG